MNFRLINFIYFIFISIVVHGQAFDESAIEDVKSNSESMFSLYASYGNFMVEREMTGLISPFIKNDYHSIGVGGVANLISKKSYRLKCYLGLLHYGVKEEYIKSTGETFNSKIKFTTIHSSIYPVSYYIHVKELKFYLGGGAYFNYNLNSNVEVTGSSTVYLPDDFFKKISSGIVGQIGVSYRNYSFEVNGYNSMSDIIESEIEQSIKIIGIAGQIVYRF